GSRDKPEAPLVDEPRFPETAGRPRGPARATAPRPRRLPLQGLQGSGIAGPARRAEASRALPAARSSSTCGKSPGPDRGEAVVGFGDEVRVDLEAEIGAAQGEGRDAAGPGAGEGVEDEDVGPVLAVGLDATLGEFRRESREMTHAVGAFVGELPD